MFTVKSPRRLNDRQKELYRELLEIEDDQPLKKVKNFFKKAKDKAMGN